MAYHFRAQYWITHGLDVLRSANCQQLTTGDRQRKCIKVLSKPKDFLHFYLCAAQATDLPTLGTMPGVRNRELDCQ